MRRVVGPFEAWLFLLCTSRTRPVVQVVSSQKHVCMIERALKVVLGEPGTVMSCLLLEKLFPVSLWLPQLLAGVLGPQVLFVHTPGSAWEGWPFVLWTTEFGSSFR